MATEILHYLKYKTKSKTDEVTMKVDISETYDRVDWVYLEEGDWDSIKKKLKVHI